MDSFFFPENVGNRFWRPETLPAREKRLRLPDEGLQCSIGVKQKESGRKTLRSSLGDCLRLGRQTESETVPVTPDFFIFKTGKNLHPFSKPLPDTLAGSRKFPALAILLTQTWTPARAAR
jgi:hypothetical protein